MSRAGRSRTDTYIVDATMIRIRRMDLVQGLHKTTNGINLWLLNWGLWFHYKFFLFVGNKGLKCYRCSYTTHIINISLSSASFLCSCLIESIDLETMYWSGQLWSEFFHGVVRANDMNHRIYRWEWHQTLLFTSFSFVRWNWIESSTTIHLIFSGPPKAHTVKSRVHFVNWFSNVKSWTEAWSSVHTLPSGGISWKRAKIWANQYSSWFALTLIRLFLHALGRPNGLSAKILSYTSPMWTSLWMALNNAPQSSNVNVAPRHVKPAFTIII